jgi:ribonuclease P protein component
VIGKYVVLFALTQPEGDARFGITATRKVGGAVVRNRAKRRIRELVRKWPNTFGGWRGDLVVNVRQGCVEAPWARLEEDYLRCITRLRLYPSRHVS